MNICLFEDAGVLNLSPVNDLRHTSELICGATTLKDKLANSLSGDKLQYILHVRKYLETRSVVKFPGLKINKLAQEKTLFLNSRIVFSRNFIRGLLFTIDEFENTVLLKGKIVVAACVNPGKLTSLKNKVENKSENNLLGFNDFHKSGLKEVQIKDLNIDENEELSFIDYPSDLISHHEKEMEEDLQYLFDSIRSTRSFGIRAEVINRKKVFISRDCRISSQVVLDASEGSIFISPKATIEPFTYVKGPVFIGSSSTVRSGSKLYGPLSIGDHCKISGEIVSSVIHSYFNKQHYGFLGHSYMCEWVNLGAGTTTSNLKNNYSKITLEIKDRKIETGSIFLGSIIGDHTKTGINTMLNTGSVIGISCNLFGGGFHPKYIRGFSWADSKTDKHNIYDIEKAITTAKISMKRRNILMSKAYENLFRYHFKKIRK